MDSLPQLSEPTKRRLALQLERSRHQHRLTLEDLAAYSRASATDRKLAASRIPDIDRRRLRPWLDSYLRSRKVSGIDSSVAVAKERFGLLASEYWPIWVSSGAEYEAFSNQIEVLESQVSADLGSIWKEHSHDSETWYQQGCAPAVEAQLTDLGKYWVQRAIDEELHRSEVEVDASNSAEHERRLTESAPQLPSEGAGGTEAWSKRLRAAREKAGLTRPGAAKGLKQHGTEITADAIKKHEAGVAKPRPVVRKAYAAIYKTAEDDLFR